MSGYRVDPPILPYAWEWSTLREDDRYYSTADYIPTPKKNAWKLTAHDESSVSKVEEERREQYARTKGNIAVVDVKPSLVEDEVYEATFWIVGHDRRKEDVPEEVTWSAGERFPIINVRRQDDPSFCATYNYYGSMLIQARLKFSDGSSAFTYVYARIPEDSQWLAPSE